MDTKPKQNLANTNGPRMFELIDAGRPNIAEMCEYFSKAADMDRALGYVNAVAAWISAKNLPSTAAETSAGLWLHTKKGKSAAVPAVAAPAPAPVLLVVACATPEVAAKVARLVGMFGCETTEV